VGGWLIWYGYMRGGFGVAGQRGEGRRGGEDRVHPWDYNRQK